jgi:DAK2 domain fusion protein YloV
MKQADSASGQDLREMFAAATDWLEKSALDVNALNVFPVPDGDTGTNMLLTMRSAIDEAYRAPDRSASAVAQAMAKGALMGARGNSGVILSQIWRGLAQGLANKESFTGSDLADCLKQASTMAYKGLSEPVEGTILTVIKDASAAAEAQVAGGNNDLISVLTYTVDAAKESVANTPSLLPVLMEAGVVDAGGQGLYVILEGALLYLKGEVEEMQFRKPWIIASSAPVVARTPQMIAADEVPYGYCTEFVLKGQGLNPDKIRTKLEKKGESLIVVGDESTVRVHIHTLDPGTVVHYATSLGDIHQVSMRNMDEQHQDYLELQKERIPEVGMAIVAVVAGDGLGEVFTSLGVTAIVPGGQTMNPSTKDLLQAVESVDSDKVIILPNNKNIVPTANQVKSLTERTIAVVPTVTIPQGVAALLAFDYEADFEANTQLMTKAKSAVRSIEVTRAVRSTRIGGLDIKKKQAIGFLDGDLVAAGDNVAGVLHEVLAKLNLDEAEVVTIYYGADTKPADAEQLSASICERHPRLQVDVVRGDQPHYNYIVSVE